MVRFNRQPVLANSPLEIARTYLERHGLQVITLRPGAFIPWWNKDVYRSYLDWAKWYWKGAVHINDVLQSVIKSIDLLKTGNLDQMPVLFVDGKYEYTPQDIEHWNAKDAGATFQKYYSAYTDVAMKFGLDPAQKPEVFDIEPTHKILGYEPTYSFLNLLQELKEFVEKGPLPPQY